VPSVGSAGRCPGFWGPSSCPFARPWLVGALVGGGRFCASNKTRPKSREDVFLPPEPARSFTNPAPQWALPVPKPNQAGCGGHWAGGALPKKHPKILTICLPGAPLNAPGFCHTGCVPVHPSGGGSPDGRKKTTVQGPPILQLDSAPAQLRPGRFNALFAPLPDRRSM